MTIQISSVEYWKKMEWNDGLLYCSLLSIDDKNDWRPMTLDEIMQYGIKDELLNMIRQHMLLYGTSLWIVPVRGG
jgi:hypothetical protein